MKKITKIQKAIKRKVNENRLRRSIKSILEASITRRFQKAVEALQDIQLKQQKLRKAFVAEKNPKKKEVLKKAIIKMHYEVKKAEEDFNRAMQVEPVDYIEEGTSKEIHKIGDIIKVSIPHIGTHTGKVTDIKKLQNTPVYKIKSSRGEFIAHQDHVREIVESTKNISEQPLTETKRVKKGTVPMMIMALGVLGGFMSYPHTAEIMYTLFGMYITYNVWQQATRKIKKNPEEIVKKGYGPKKGTPEERYIRMKADMKSGKYDLYPFFKGSPGPWKKKQEGKLTETNVDQLDQAFLDAKPVKELGVRPTIEENPALVEPDGTIKGGPEKEEFGESTSGLPVSVLKKFIMPEKNDPTNERAYASTDGKPYFDYDPGQGKLTEAGIPNKFKVVRKFRLQGFVFNTGDYVKKAEKFGSNIVLNTNNNEKLSIDFGDFDAAKRRGDIKEGKLNEGAYYKRGQKVRYQIDRGSPKALRPSVGTISKIKKVGHGYQYTIMDGGPVPVWEAEILGPTSHNEGKLTEQSAMKAIIKAKKGAKASGGGYSSWTKISNNSWKNKKTGRLTHDAGLYDRIGEFSDFIIEGKLNERYTFEHDPTDSRFHKEIEHFLAELLKAIKESKNRKVKSLASKVKGAQGVAKRFTDIVGQLRVHPGGALGRNEGKLNEGADPHDVKLLAKAKPGQTLSLKGELWIKTYNKNWLCKKGKLKGTIYYPDEMAQHLYRMVGKGIGYKIKEGKLNEASDFPNIKKWWKEDKKKIMTFVYWQQRQIPPSNKSAYDRNWRLIVKHLHKQFPAPHAEYRKRLQEIDMDRVFMKGRTKKRTTDESITKKKQYGIGDTIKVSLPNIGTTQGKVLDIKLLQGKPVYRIKSYRGQVIAHQDHVKGLIESALPEVVGPLAGPGKNPYRMKKADIPDLIFGIGVLIVGLTFPAAQLILYAMFGLYLPYKTWRHAKEACRRDPSYCEKGPKKGSSKFKQILRAVGASGNKVDMSAMGGLV